MKLYFSTIGAAMAVVYAMNIALDTAPWYYIILAVIWCTALQFVLDGIVAIIVNKLPDSLFGIDNPHFEVSKKEINIYKRLRIRQWKDKVWELGGLGGFSKKNLKEPKNPEYIERFIVESNKGVATHRLSYPIGFLAMLTVKGKAKYTIALPIALVNLFLNVLPTMVLRYNTPMLKSLLKRLKRNNSREENQSAVVT